VPVNELLEAAGVACDGESVVWADIELKYAGYLAREQANAARMGELEGFTLSASLTYRSFHSLSFEAREKLHAVKPSSLGQASRIPGVSPSDLQNLVVEVLKWRRAGSEPACFT
jgi:tRNA uridine 5-carboxymethylaminomethyl modification enzyme